MNGNLTVPPREIAAKGQTERNRILVKEMIAQEGIAADLSPNLTNALSPMVIPNQSLESGKYARNLTGVELNSQTNASSL